MDSKQTVEAIAFTEKKVSMSLDDIIKMSKKKNLRGKGPHRQPIKKQSFQNGNGFQGTSKAKSYMDSRSSIRQGVLAQRRSSYNDNQFPATSQAARRAAAMPVRSRPIRWNKESVASTSQWRRGAIKAFDNRKGEMPSQKPRTMDALFAHMKEQRLMKTLHQPRNAPGVRQLLQRPMQPRQGRPAASSWRFG